MVCPPGWRAIKASRSPSGETAKKLKPVKFAFSGGRIAARTTFARAGARLNEETAKARIMIDASAKTAATIQGKNLVSLAGANLGAIASVCPDTVADPDSASMANARSLAE